MGVTCGVRIVKHTYVTGCCAENCVGLWMGWRPWASNAAWRSAPLGAGREFGERARFHTFAVLQTHRVTTRPGTSSCRRAQHEPKLLEV